MAVFTRPVFKADAKKAHVYFFGPSSIGPTKKAQKGEHNLGFGMHPLHAPNPTTGTVILMKFSLQKRGSVELNLKF